MTKKKQENCLKRRKYLAHIKYLAILISVWYNRKRKEVKKVTAKDRYNKKNYDTILLRVQTLITAILLTTRYPILKILIIRILRTKQ